MAVKERVKFMMEWEKRWNEGQGKLNFALLCREFGVSRPVAYEWISRYRESEHDLGAAKERSRRPHSSPPKVSGESGELEDALVEFRKLHPTWGSATR